jgi:hypothetical protein
MKMKISAIESVMAEIMQLKYWRQSAAANQLAKWNDENNENESNIEENAIRNTKNESSWHSER